MVAVETDATHLCTPGDLSSAIPIDIDRDRFERQVIARTKALYPIANRWAHTLIYRNENARRRSRTQNWRIGTGQRPYGSGHEQYGFGDLISYQSDRKGYAVIADKVSKP
jgi:hypothetical protein